MGTGQLNASDSSQSRLIMALEHSNKEGGMRVLGFHILTGQLRYTVLEGAKKSPALIAKDRLITTDPENVPELMDWYDTQFRHLINTLHPERLSYRLTLEPKKDQLFCSEFPFGVLNLVAHRMALPISSYSSKAFTPNKLGLPKGTDLYAHCDAVLGEHPPYWDKNQKNSVLVAWFEL